VRATRQACQALRAADAADIPANLSVLYLRMPEAFAVRCWRRVLASPRGELWFAAHSRAAPPEMTSLGAELRAAVHRAGRPAPVLDALLSRGCPPGSVPVHSRCQEPTKRPKSMSLPACSAGPVTCSARM